MIESLEGDVDGKSTETELTPISKLDSSALYKNREIKQICDRNV
jgi:hypothetical protein